MADTRAALSDEAQQHLREAVADVVLTTPGLPADERGTTPEDLCHLIAAAALVAGAGETILCDAVRSSRRAGLSWQVIGATLGISRQAAQQRFREVEKGEPDPSRRTVRYANAFNELDVLRHEGEAGYHLVGFGPSFLTLAASTVPWEHRRVTAFGQGGVRQRIESEGWTYVGTWFPFHYFKRPARQEGSAPD